MMTALWTNKNTPSPNQNESNLFQFGNIFLIHVIQAEILIANPEIQFRYSGYSNDCSPISNGKSNALFYLCDDNIPDKPLPILSHTQSEDFCLRRNHLYDNNSSPNITPIAPENIRTRSADNATSDSDPSDRHMSESGADLIMHSYPQINSLYEQIKTLKIINEKLLVRNHSIISELDEVGKLISFQIVLLLYIYALAGIVLYVDEQNIEIAITDNIIIQQPKQFQPIPSVAPSSMTTRTLDILNNNNNYPYLEDETEGRVSSTTLRLPHENSLHSTDIESKQLVTPQSYPNTPQPSAHQFNKYKILSTHLIRMKINVKLIVTKYKCDNQNNYEYADNISDDSLNKSKHQSDDNRYCFSLHERLLSMDILKYRNIFISEIFDKLISIELTFKKMFANSNSQCIQQIMVYMNL